MSRSTTLMLIQNGMQCLQPPNHSCILTATRNDILRKHGVIPEKPVSPTPMIQEAIEEARQREYDNRLEDKDLDELDALEDEEDEEFLEMYRYAHASTLALPSLFSRSDASFFFFNSFFN